MFEVRVTFLGTGTSQGVPVIACECEVCRSSNPKDNRLRSSVLIEEGDTTIVIDTGPDFRQQMLRSGVKNIDGVLFTHGHKDHIAGFDDIRAFNYIHRKAMQVYGDRFVEKALKRDFYYAFEEHKYPGVPELDLHIIDNNEFEVGGVPITPIEVIHYRLPVKGFRIGDFTYITDANHIDEEEKAKIKGSKVLVLNALRKTKHISHFTLDEAVDLGRELGVGSVYFTHMSHQMGLHDEVQKSLPKGMYLAYDQLQVEL